jgi:hypothetical protein
VISYGNYHRVCHNQITELKSMGKVKRIEWGSDQDLKFKNQRTQPVIDMAKESRLKIQSIFLILGGGLGNSTGVEYQRNDVHAVR